MGTNGGDNAAMGYEGYWEKRSKFFEQLYTEERAKRESMMQSTRNFMKTCLDFSGFVSGDNVTMPTLDAQIQKFEEANGTAQPTTVASAVVSTVPTWEAPSSITGTGQSLFGPGPSQPVSQQMGYAQPQTQMGNGNFQINGQQQQIGYAPQATIAPTFRGDEFQNRNMFTHERFNQMLANKFGATARTMHMSIFNGPIKNLRDFPDHAFQKKLDMVRSLQVDYKTEMDVTFGPDESVFYCGDVNSERGAISWSFTPCVSENENQMTLKMYLSNRIKSALFIKLRTAFRQPMLRWREHCRREGQREEKKTVHKLFQFGQLKKSAEAEATDQLFFKITADPNVTPFVPILSVFVRYLLLAPRRLTSAKKFAQDVAEKDVQEIANVVEAEMSAPPPAVW